MLPYWSLFGIFGFAALVTNEKVRRPGVVAWIAGGILLVVMIGLRREVGGGWFGYVRNFERLLPRRPRGYYHEYTVRTPGARNRGARRIVCGGPPRQIDNCFYSDDHYTSFKRIIE